MKIGNALTVYNSKPIMTKHRETKSILLIVFLVPLLSISCSFSVTSAYNSTNPTSKETRNQEIKEVKDRDDLKLKATEAVNHLHKLIEERKFEDAYQMIDDNSALKHPKTEAIKNLQEVVDNLGNLEKIDLTRDKIVKDGSLNGGQLQVRQEFIVKFEKDDPSPKRYEIFIWNVHPGDKLKLWTYINAKSED